MIIAFFGREDNGTLHAVAGIVYGDKVLKVFTHQHKAVPYADASVIQGNQVDLEFFQLDIRLLSHRYHGLHRPLGGVGRRRSRIEFYISSQAEGRKGIPGKFHGAFGNIEFGRLVVGASGSQHGNG